jgi:hypothetical protein
LNRIGQSFTKWLEYTGEPPIMDEAPGDIENYDRAEENQLPEEPFNIPGAYYYYYPPWFI